MLDPGLPFRLMTILTLTAGTCFIMWLGEQITEKGIGNGISLIIFAGIVADLPVALYQLWQKTQDDPENFGPMFIAILGALVVAVIAFVVIMERGQRRIQVQYAKRVVGRQMFGGNANYLPLRLNSAGVIPPIFASSILMFPSQIAGMTGSSSMQWFSNALRYDGWLYLTAFVGLVIFFTFFYTSLQFNPVDVADNLKKQNASIPGSAPASGRPSTSTSSSRASPSPAPGTSPRCASCRRCCRPINVPFYYGGTSLLIVVGVALDTAQQIESHLVTRSYEGFAGPGGPRIRGRRG
ncbi:preprotein translocase subunit SecY [Nannocystis pusilla]|uniref:preprotein translocase subunit SecY n=1 Tax=Nannocystis pusilla TaxID=889268 RepID=UPI003B7A3B8F